MTLPIGVLDQSPVSEGMTGAGALQNTIDLARLADALGYHRYWVAEHHGGAAPGGAGPGARMGARASAPARGRAGLPPLLGGRAPRRAVAGRAEPGGADRADRVGHGARPRGLRRRD